MLVFCSEVSSAWQINSMSVMLVHISCCSRKCYRCILHVIYTDPSSKSAAGWLEDTSIVQKYVMYDDEYAKRENTYISYKLMKQ